MKKLLTITCSLVLLSSLMAEEKVTYGKTTFTFYKEVPTIAPTTPSGWKAPSAGYLLKQPGYGPTTYYCFAPGKVSAKRRDCIYQELRDWVYHTPETIESNMVKYNLTKVDEKTFNKLFKRSTLFSGTALYNYENKYFGVEYNESFYSDKKPYAKRIFIIERLPMTETTKIMNYAWSYWNDIIQLSDRASLLQKNTKAKMAPMNSHQTPPYFTVAEVLNLKKGFYTFAIENNAGTYQWHPYEPVFEASIAKKDFYLEGSSESKSLEDPFFYSIYMVRDGNDVLVAFEAATRFLNDLEPGRSWQKEMQSRREQKIEADREMKKIYIQNGTALEGHYKEIFK